MPAIEKGYFNGIFKKSVKIWDGMIIVISSA